jgi:PEP-CTERM motif
VNINFSMGGFQMLSMKIKRELTILLIIASGIGWLSIPSRSAMALSAGLSDELVVNNVTYTAPESGESNIFATIYTGILPLDPAVTPPLPNGYISRWLVEPDPTTGLPLIDPATGNTVISDIVSIGYLTDPTTGAVSYYVQLFSDTDSSGVPNTFCNGPSLPFGCSLEDPAGNAFQEPGVDVLVISDAEETGAAVPEPSSLLLFGSGIASLVAWGRKMLKRI